MEATLSQDFSAGQPRVVYADPDEGLSGWPEASCNPVRGGGPTADEFQPRRELSGTGFRRYAVLDSGLQCVSGSSSSELRRQWLPADVHPSRAIFPLLILLSMIAGGPIVAFEILDSVQLQHSKVVAYRLNGGATTDYAIRVSQELR
jgi:hypothetical protein